MAPLTDPARAHACLDQALYHADDIAYFLLVGEAADIAAALEDSHVDEAVRIWVRIADLDGDRARLWDLVDEARTRVQSAGIDTPPTTAQAHAAYLTALSPAERFSWDMRILYGEVMSTGNHSARLDTARRALALFAAYERAHKLSKKQAQRKLVLQLFLKQEASSTALISSL